MSFFKSLAGQFFYWLALRFQVVHDVGGPVPEDMLTERQIRNHDRYSKLMALSNKLTFGDVERAKKWDKYQNRVELCLLGVSHNPERKLHPDSVL